MNNVNSSDSKMNFKIRFDHKENRLYGEGSKFSTDYKVSIAARRGFTGWLLHTFSGIFSEKKWAKINVKKENSKEKVTLYVNVNSIAKRCEVNKKQVSEKLSSEKSSTYLINKLKEKIISDEKNDTEISPEIKLKLQKNTDIKEIKGVIAYCSYLDDLSSCLFDEKNESDLKNQLEDPNIDDKTKNRVMNKLDTIKNRQERIAAYPKKFEGEWLKIASNSDLKEAFHADDLSMKNALKQYGPNKSFRVRVLAVEEIFKRLERKLEDSVYQPSSENQVRFQDVPGEKEFIPNINTFSGIRILFRGLTKKIRAQAEEGKVHFKDEDKKLLKILKLHLSTLKNTPEFKSSDAKSKVFERAVARLEKQFEEMEKEI